MLTEQFYMILFTHIQELLMTVITTITHLIPGTTIQTETIRKNLAHAAAASGGGGGGGAQVEEQIMREMRRKILEVSLGQIYTTEVVNEDDIVNDNDILFLQSLPDDETRDPNAVYLCIVNKVSLARIFGARKKREQEYREKASWRGYWAAALPFPMPIGEFLIMLSKIFIELLCACKNAF